MTRPLLSLTSENFGVNMILNLVDITEEISEVILILRKKSSEIIKIVYVPSMCVWYHSFTSRFSSSVQPLAMRVINPGCLILIAEKKRRYDCQC